MRRLLQVALAQSEWVEVMSSLEGAALDLRNSGVPAGSSPEEVEEQARRLMRLKATILRQVGRRLRKAVRESGRLPLFLERQTHENGCAFCGRELWDPRSAEVHDTLVILDAEYTGHASPDALGSWCSLACFIRDLRERFRVRMERAKHRKDRKA